MKTWLYVFVAIFILFALNNAKAGPYDSTEVLLVTNPTFTEGDDAILDSLENLGLTVTTITHDEVSADWAEGMGFVYISSSVSSGNVTNIFKEVEVPVLMIEPYALDDMGMTLDDDQHRFFQGVQRPIVIEAEGHFLAAGLTGEVDFLLDYELLQSAQGIPGDEGVIIANYLQDSTDTNWIYGAIFAYEKGDTLA